MGNFNLNKNEEEGKKERFSLNKSPETSPEPEKKDRFSLNKGEGVSTTTTEKKDRFSLNKGQEAQNTSPEKKVNLSPNEGSETSANALEEVAGHTADKSVAPVATASDFTKLKKEILADGKIDKEEVDRLRKELYSDGKIDEEEANFLFELNDAVGEKKNDPSWNQFFVTAITDYLLKDEKSPGVIDEEEGKWLVEKIGSDGKVDGVEKQLLDNLKKNAKKMPKIVEDLAVGKTVALAAQVSNLTKLKKEILADGKIDKDEVDRLRKELYSDGKIDEEEANFLFELNDAVSEKKNDPSWNQFFVTAISDYLLKDEKSPGVIDDEEGKWLVEKIGSDGKVDGVEKQLLDNLKKNAKKMPKIVEALAVGKTVALAAQASNLTKLKKEILADGKIDKDEVDRLRKELYSDGKIDEEEANFLFELNDAVGEKKNDPSWNQFFVSAISDYLLKDEKSPGVIDEEEGKWLVEKIGSDGKVDGVEKQLLDNLKKNAKKMPKNVEALANSQPLTNGIKNKEVGNDDTRKSHKWIWWLIILILIIALIVVIMRNCKSDNSLSNNKQVDPIEQQDTNSQEEPTPNGDTIEVTENNNIAQDIPVGQSESESSGKVASNENNQVAITNNKPLSEKDRGSAVIKQNDKPISVEKGKPIAQKTTDVRNYSQNPIDLSDKTVEELAKAVIRGNYGNGVDRKRALGDRYSEIQQRVNEIYRERGL